MKNKRGISLIVTLLMIILLIMVAIGIFWYVTEDILEPHFKITKEECITKSFSDLATTGCEIGCIKYSLEYMKEKEGSYDEVVLLRCKNYCYELSYEDCEQVKVDEIEIIKTKKECFGWANRENISDEDYLHYGIPCIDLRLKNETIKISKQDLTEEWLDENCECVEMTFEGKTYKTKVEIYEINMSKETAKKYCSKYSC